MVLRIGFLVGFGFFKVDLDPDLLGSYEYPVLEMIPSLMNQSMGESSHGGEVYAKCYDERGQPVADAGIATRGVTKIVVATETVGGKRQLALLAAVSRDEIMVVDRYGPRN
ncbi:unnamed protein product [Prunus armeniaca]|uniref:Uncharacterized protein n=1 Tax=Prunus armeniaca TaxID=36596 RepID=A0A6J5WCP9_PRUAR|nr:unnamed protein product [Prunus armeniaca]